ncbi:MAG TPA: phosphotransferase [Symbiobacteriaceae bacterium]|nr:phosphotransferase [Symbiobacteriaceae bacterium]
MDDALARRALAELGLDASLLHSPPLNRRRKRAVWRAGGYALKWFFHGAQAEKVAAVSRHLHGRGIPLPPPEGPVYLEGGCFLLFPWVDGRMPGYSEPGMLEAITGLLARFHRASEGFGPVEPDMRDWGRLWADERHHLHKLAALAAERDDDFSRCLLGALPWLRERIRWCQKLLPAATGAPAPLLGHGDYSRQNLLLGPDGSLTVIDLDQVSASLPVRDLSRLITWVDHDLQGWSGERFQAIVAAYGGLTPAEFDLLCLDQVMPHLAVDIAREYYGGVRGTCLEELERCLLTDQSKLRDLQLGPAC